MEKSQEGKRPLDVFGFFFLFKFSYYFALCMFPFFLCIVWVDHSNPGLTRTHVDTRCIEGIFCIVWVDYLGPPVPFLTLFGGEIALLK